MALVAHVRPNPGSRVSDGVAVQAFVVLGDLAIQITNKAFEVDKVVLFGNEHAVCFEHVIDVRLQIGGVVIAEDAARWREFLFRRILVVLLFDGRCLQAICKLGDSCVGFRVLARRRGSVDGFSERKRRAHHGRSIICKAAGLLQAGLTKLVLRTSDVVLKRVFAVECLLTGTACLLVGCSGGGGSGAGLGCEDLFREDFMGHWRQGSNTALDIVQTGEGLALGLGTVRNAEVEYLLPISAHMLPLGIAAAESH